MERYRGTEWDNLPIEGVVPLAPARSRTVPGLLLMMGVLAMSLVVATVFVGLRPVDPLPAAVSRRPITQPSPAVAPGASPAATGQPASPNGSMAPQPSLQIDPALTGSPAGAFVTLMMAGDPHYHAEARGTFALGNLEGTVSIDLAVSGADIDGTWIVARDRERRVTSVIVKDERYFVKPAGDPWQRSETGDGLPRDVFGQIPPGAWQALTYVGPEERDGRQLHHLRLPAFDWPAISDAFYLDDHQGGVVVHDIRVDVWVTEAGKPSAARIWFDATTWADGVEVDLSYELEYEFSGVGQRVEIKAPRVSDGGRASS